MLYVIWDSGKLPFGNSFAVYPMVHRLGMLFLIEVKITLHKINHFKVYNLVVFRAFTNCTTNHLYVVPKYYVPKRKPHPN